MNRRDMITATLASVGLSAIDVQRLAVEPDDVAIIITPAIRLSREHRIILRAELAEVFKGTPAERLKILIQPPGWKMEALRVPKR